MMKCMMGEQPDYPVFQNKIHEVRKRIQSNQITQGNQGTCIQLDYVHVSPV